MKTKNTTIQQNKEGKKKQKLISLINSDFVRSPNNAFLQCPIAWFAHFPGHITVYLYGEAAVA